MTIEKVKPSKMPWEDTVEDDVIVDVLRLVLELAPGFSAELARQVDRDVRARWGGDSAYIARRHGEGRSARNAQILRDYQSGARTGALVRRYGLTPRQIQRIVAQAKPAT